MSHILWRHNKTKLEPSGFEGLVGIILWSMDMQPFDTLFKLSLATAIPWILRFQNQGTKKFGIFVASYTFFLTWMIGDDNAASWPGRFGKDPSINA